MYRIFEGKARRLAPIILTLSALLAPGAASADPTDRIERDVNRARLEMRASDGQTFRPRSFVVVNRDSAYSAPAPRRFDAEAGAGLPAERLPLIGGLFRQSRNPAPNESGAPVYGVGDAMVIDLSGMPPEEASGAREAVMFGRLFIISRSRHTVVNIRPFLRPNDFSATPPPDLGGEQIGEAFFDGKELVIAPLARDYYGFRPW